jgi:O-antigen/teichoic acid export membrane protein/CelD/BcsL family acetyltransferase involved in cellulose biosynthesis
VSATDSLEDDIRVQVRAAADARVRVKPDTAPASPQPWTQKVTQAARNWLTDTSHDSLAQRVASAAFLIRIVSALLAYVSQIVLARWMGMHEFGVFVYVWTWTLLIGGFADAGLAAAAQKFIPEYAKLESFAHVRGFIAGSRWLAAGLATALALAAIVAIKLAEPLLEQSAVIPLYIACFCLPIYALCSVQDGIARCYNSIGVGLMPSFIIRPILLLALMAAAHFSGFENDATTAVICSVIAFWIVGLTQTVLLQRSLSGSVPVGDRAYELVNWISMSLPIVMVTGFYVLLTYVDIIILQQYRPPEDVALYHAATKTLTLVTFVYFAVSAATAHRFSEYQTAGDHVRLQAFIAKATQWTFWPSLAMTALVLALGQFLLMLFGSDFTTAYPLMFALAFGLLARASIGPSERLLVMVGQQKACASAYAAAFAINLVACLVFIPLFGGMGAALSTSFALLAETIILFRVVRRRLGLYSFIFPERVTTPRTRDNVATVDSASIVPPQTDAVFEIEWRTPNSLGDITDEWRELCTRAIEPNAFFEPAIVLSGAQVFGKNLTVGLVWSTAFASRQLVGLLPIQITRRNGITPVVEGFTHSYGLLGTPLFDREMAVPAIAALLDHVSENPQLPKTLLLPLVAEDGPFATAFHAALAQRAARFAVFDRHQRAVFAPVGDREGYFTRALSGKKRKEFRRQRNRLEDDGMLAFSLSTQQDTAAALDDFLTLEAEGWKGSAGTAVARQPEVSKFFTDAVLGLASTGQATIARLTQGGRTIAAGVVIKSGSGAWFWKVAYDETLSQNSPGVQLTLELTEALARDQSIAFIDSCAIADHPMIDRIWRERRQMADWLICVDPRRPFAADRTVEQLRRHARKTAKRIYHLVR